LSLNYWGESDSRSLFRNEALALTGFGLIILSRVVSRKAVLNLRLYTVFMVLLSTGAAAGLSALMSDSIDTAELSYSEGRDALKALLHPGAGNYIVDIDSYVNGLIVDDEKNLAEKEAEILALNTRIAAMESELSLFEAARKETESIRQENIALKAAVKAALDESNTARIRSDGNGEVTVVVNGEEIRRVIGFAGAVNPDLPMVRDFAAALASKTPGSYYRDDGDRWAAGPDGVKQIIGIHRYISGEWKYVNDPAQTVHDYNSPAHRTLAVGLAGDCDDYAILVSSSIEAIGGKTRIMGGGCSGGAHAWPEVYIGSRTAFNEAFAIISREYPGRKIQYSTDSIGGCWLPLDWQLGVYSCGENPEVIYQRIGGTS
jgi:hypothetical protein